MPYGANILCAGVQGDGSHEPEHVVIWADVEPDHDKMRMYSFKVAGTGHPTPEPPYAYLNTVFMEGFVWHVYHKQENTL